MTGNDRQMWLLDVYSLLYPSIPSSIHSFTVSPECTTSPSLTHKHNKEKVLQETFNSWEIYLKRQPHPGKLLLHHVNNSNLEIILIWVVQGQRERPVTHRENGSSAWWPWGPSVMEEVGLPLPKGTGMLVDRVLESIFLTIK